MIENEIVTKIVDYAKYCPQCKHRYLDDTDDPCNECMAHPARTDGSRKPMNFEEEE